MKVCIICSGFSRIYGGVESVVSELSERWAENGYEVFVLSGQGKKSSPKGVRLIKLPFLPSNIFQRIPLLKKVFSPSEFEALSLLPSALLYLIGINPDIVLSNKLAETLPAEILNIPHVMFSQAPIMSRLTSFKKADRVVVNDENSYERLIKYSTNVEFLLNGVNVSRVHETDQKKIKAKYGISNSSKVILTIARLDFNKRINLLIDAFKLIKQDYTLIIVGDGPELSSLKRQAAAIKSENKIFFVRPMSHEKLNEFYQMCDVFTLPSKFEAAPLVLLEALSFGKVVVTNPAPEKKSILREFGVFANVEDPIEYSEALILSSFIKIDVNSGEYTQHLQKFTWTNIAVQYQKLFDDVLMKRHFAQNQGRIT